MLFYHLSRADTYFIIARVPSVPIQLTAADVWLLAGVSVAVIVTINVWLCINAVYRVLS